MKTTIYFLTSIASLLLIVENVSAQHKIVKDTLKKDVPVTIKKDTVSSSVIIKTVVSASDVVILPVVSDRSQSDVAKDIAANIQAARDKKSYDAPFQYWPTSDTVLSDQFQVSLTNEKSVLKNYSTVDARAVNKPVIKSVDELCYELQNNKMDTIRYYGDGWNERTAYDQNGNLTNQYVIFEDEDTRQDSAYLTTTYLYHGAALRLKQYFWWESGIKEAEEQLEYDQNGKLWKVYYTALNENGEEIRDEGRGFRTLYTYSDHVQIEENYERLADAQNQYVLDETIAKTLNNDGKVVERKKTAWPQKKPSLIIKYTYDQKGNMLFSEDKNSTYTYQYNEHDDVIKTTFKRARSEDRGTTTYTYQYDKHNNWISKEEVVVEESTAGRTENAYLWKRNIVYYTEK